eukprot:TRINITY_DN14952_c0_g1_i3.p1 TRINITY_DN14952_c0_g1~~TRINITY_DN14952_c0_g1_i3.p1  ORF type:complete len:120 (+),score=46.69 TRINITY_DN14952_c0_g1_i3:190-549(+)
MCIRDRSNPERWYQVEERLCNNKLKEVESMLKRAAAALCPKQELKERELYADKMVEPHMANAQQGCIDPDEDNDEENDATLEMGRVVVMPVYPCWDKKHELPNPARSCLLYTSPSPRDS